MPKVLLIDDKMEDLKLVERDLKPKGYQVVTAKNGYEGVYQFDKEKPDIVVVDFNMPGISGSDVCKSLKKKNPAIPIILLTIHSNIQNKKEAFQAGCDDYLTKPCETEELMVRMENLLRRAPKKGEQDKLSYGYLALDRKAHRVTKNGKPIELSLTEYTLLEYLLENVDQVLSRKMILEHVWGTNNPETFTNIVDVYINYLRKKVDDPGQRSLIKTIRGFGYMLEDLNLRKAA